jgi:hypothetical protein
VSIGHGANIVTLPEETGRNGENKAAPKTERPALLDHANKLLLVLLKNPQKNI